MSGRVRRSGLRSRLVCFGNGMRATTQQQGGAAERMVAVRGRQRHRWHNARRCRGPASVSVLRTVNGAFNREVGDGRRERRESSSVKTARSHQRCPHAKATQPRWLVSQCVATKGNKMCDRQKNVA